ncbi:MAG: hypothetical protein QOH17_658 [Pseudonocardiales bacterium]|nr:hypothetical protein [Pseudonocardiales bacterium]
MHATSRAGSALLALTALLLTTLVTLGLRPAVAATCTEADAIDQHWCQLGGAQSVLGLPVGTAFPIGPGRARNYQHGRILWSAPTGAREVHGAILAAFDRLAGVAGVLGFPVTDESTPPDRVGRFNHFSKSASIYWTPSTGAHEVQGGIRAKWASLGWEVGILGYPTTDESTTPDRVGRFNHFSKAASVYWTPSTGAHEVHGSIRSRWAGLGWERGALGYPISDEFSANGDRQSDFQRGFLRWNPGPLRAVRLALLEPYGRAGTWVTRFTFSREFAGANPPVRPSDVDVMADAGVRVLYLQTAVYDSRYPGLISPDLLGAFLVRAHQRGMRVVGWYLPHFTSVSGDLARLRATIDFRSAGQAFDAVAVDIEDPSVADLNARNAALISLSQQLRDLAPQLTLGAIVLPPIVTDVLARPGSPSYWPNFPWRALAGVYQVWMPMAYWTNRTETNSPYRHDAAHYLSENITRTRADLGEPCAAVSAIGGDDRTATLDEYSGMATGARSTGAVGISFFDWTATVSTAWSRIADYDGRGC